MSLSEAYQQALLNGSINELFVSAGNTFRIKLLYNGVELAGSGYGQLAITSVPEAGDIEDDDFVRLSLESSQSITAVNSSVTWNQLELWDAALANLVLPRFNTSGTIPVGQSGKVIVKITCENIENPVDPTPVATTTLFDFTIGNQLSNIYGIRTGLDIPSAVPVRTFVSGTYGASHPLEGESFAVGTVYSLYQFNKAACTNYSDLDYEEWVFPFVNAGTIGIVNGVVTGSGTNFPVYTINYMTGRLYVGNEIYEVATRTNSTSLILFDTSVNVAPGTSYKYARWDHRQQDPTLAFNDKDWQEPINEWCYALTLVNDQVLANNAHPCWYERGVPIYTRYLDIRDNPNTWKQDVELLCNYRSTSGFTYKEYLHLHDSYILGNCYVANAINDSSGAQDGFITFVENLCNVMIELDIPLIPLLKFKTTENDNDVDLEFLERIIRAIHAIKPYQIGFWAFEDEVTPANRVWLQSIIESL